MIKPKHCYEVVRDVQNSPIKVSKFDEELLEFLKDAWKPYDVMTLSRESVAMYLLELLELRKKIKSLSKRLQKTKAEYKKYRSENPKESFIYADTDAIRYMKNDVAKTYNWSVHNVLTEFESWMLKTNKIDLSEYIQWYVEELNQESKKKLNSLYGRLCFMENKE